MTLSKIFKTLRLQVPEHWKFLVKFKAKFNRVENLIKTYKVDSSLSYVRIINNMRWDFPLWNRFGRE